MPKRKIFLVNKEFYHVINRGIFSQNIFLNKWNYQRALESLFFYQNDKLPIKYSSFITKSKKEKNKLLSKIKSKKLFLAEIIAYCLMPNHFHLLLKQKVNNGISKFIGSFTNSYAHYFNSRTKRKGPLFETKFKAIRIETEKQLIHVSRYIHLNPYSSHVVKNFKDLEVYPYSSLPEYLGKATPELCQKDVILNLFKNKNKYHNFVFNQADYQRKLSRIKHLLLEN